MMNTKKIVLISYGLLIVLVLAACSAKVSAPADTSQPIVKESLPVDTSVPVDATATVVGTRPAEVKVVEEPTLPAAEIDVEALIREKLSGHHSENRIFDATKTREEWNTTIDRMIGYGAKINEEEKKIIIDYLLSR
jgi:hypothetical protein